MKVIKFSSLKGRVVFSLSLFFAFAWTGCSVEDLQNASNASGKASDSASSLVLEKGNAKQGQQGFEDFSMVIKNKIDEGAKKNYEMMKELLNESMDKTSIEERKYQFLCDENERWIYRCNLITGEIECFSMSSNKLRLLSSIK